MHIRPVLFYCEAFNDCDENLNKIVNYFGVECESLALKKGMNLENFLSNKKQEDKWCVFISSQTLRELIENNNYDQTFKRFIYNEIDYLFVYSFLNPSLEHKYLDYISNGKIKSVSTFNDENLTYCISDKAQDICGQFSGLTVAPINYDTDYGFEVSDTYNITDTLISIGRHPFFLNSRENRCNMFFVGNSCILDIDMPLGEQLSLKSYFSQIVPIMIFCKFVFGDMCWHNSQKYGNFIIDDPLLSNNYGFINYNKLLNSMEEHDYTSTIAFIPWNYKRTKKKASEFFLKNAGRFSIAVHGFDHTYSEFGDKNIDILNTKSAQAIENMEWHRNYTQLDFEKIMVFPQGIFSSAAMRALKANNYSAAINSTHVSIDSPTEEIKIRDFLELAIMNYDTFSLFIRRYPNDDIFDFAFDLFLGKPLFLVEHHGFFNEGYDSINSIIEKVKSLDKELEWKGLGHIINSAYKIKKLADGSIHCKIYSNDVFIENESNDERQYCIIKEENKNVPILNVLVNNHIYNFEANNGLLVVNLLVKPESKIRIQILYKNNLKFLQGSLKKIDYIFKVSIRRFLSEIRDNYISRNDRILKFAYVIKKILHQ